MTATTRTVQMVLCADCAALRPDATPLGMWSVDGCDTCDNGGAGHQAYDVPAILAPLDDQHRDRLRQGFSFAKTMLELHFPADDITSFLDHLTFNARYEAVRRLDPGDDDEQRPETDRAVA